LCKVEKVRFVLALAFMMGTGNLIELGKVALYTQQTYVGVELGLGL